MDGLADYQRPASQWATYVFSPDIAIGAGMSTAVVARMGCADLW